MGVRDFLNKFRRKDVVEEREEEEEIEIKQIPSFDELLFKNANKWVIMYKEDDDLPLRENMYYFKLNEWGQIDPNYVPIPVPKDIRRRALLESVLMGNRVVDLTRFQIVSHPAMTPKSENIKAIDRIAERYKKFIRSFEIKKGAFMKIKGEKR